MKRRLEPTPPAASPPLEISGEGAASPGERTVLPGEGTALPGGVTPPPPSSRALAHAASSAERRRDRLFGLIIVAVSFVICLAVSIWAKERSRPETSAPPGPPTIDGLEGFPSAVDPIASLVAAKKLTSRTLLRGIVIDGARSDGLLDLSEGPGRVRYSFQSPPGQGPQPPLQPGTLPKRVTCGRQYVALRKEGLVAEPDAADFPCPIIAVEPLPEPQCGTKDIWRLARKRRVPRDQPAHIEYYRAKAGPAWRFEITGTSHRFTVYGDCKRELIGAEAHGSVP